FHVTGVQTCALPIFACPRLRLMTIQSYNLPYSCIGTVRMQHENDRSGHSDLEERTTKARIRDAAITEFSEKGFNGASIRGIAERAGVSPGLVQHHFGTKQELREACDQHVMKMFQRALVEGYRRGGVDDPGFIDEMYRSMLPLVSYLMMSIGS